MRLIYTNARYRQIESSVFDHSYVHCPILNLVNKVEFERKKTKTKKKFKFQSTYSTTKK